MSEKSKTKVYILGAGCSTRSGYPVADNFLPELESFGKSLNDQAPQIKKCVEETVALMRQGNVATIDDLTDRLHRGSFGDNPSQGLTIDRQLRDRRIENAKIATAAMFLSKEKSARQTGLRNYHDLLLEMMPGGLNWEEKLKRCNWHVLTFNYDRLFEIAVWDRLEPDLCKRFGLYSSGILNSGINPLMPEIQFEEERFSYLKLHGSVGMRVQHEYGSDGIAYQPFDGEGFAAGEITDSRFFGGSIPVNSFRPWPLLVIPFEKQHVQAGGQHLYYKKYIDAVWNRARTLIANASEIHIVGYAFQAIDKDALINLLANARNCERGIIQNLPGEAERICRMLAIKHPELGIKWEPYSEAF